MCAARGVSSVHRLRGSGPARFVRASAETGRAVATTPGDGLRNAGPDPKAFTVPDGQLQNIATAAFPALVRLGSGGFGAGYSPGLAADDGTYGAVKFGGQKLNETSALGSFKRPAQPLQLYEFEGCPYCRKVREAVSILGLDVEVFPCPKEGTRFRPQVVAEGGKAQFPYLKDPNTGTAMYESDDIISYLFQEYGPGEVPLPLRLHHCHLRPGPGAQARPSKQPTQPLVLWGYELSPFVKVVKEVLCELELPYLQVTVPRGSPRRQELLEKRGHFQVPYLEDPGAGVYLFESAAIIKYLEDTYAA